MIEAIAKKIIHIVNGNRKMYYRNLREVAKHSDGKIVLEIGSGKKIRNEYRYSAVHLFPTAKEFVMTDTNPSFGHTVLDLTKMNDRNQYDIILCLNVLEHVYDFENAIINLHRALKKNGTLIVAVPFTFPLHDEPGDYWRFTEHALRKMFADFSIIKITPQRLRRWPAGYFAVVTK